MKGRGWERPRWSLVVLLAMLLALGGTPGVREQALARAPTGAITGEDLVRNGTFDQDKTTWAIVGSSSSVANVGQDGGPAMSLEAIMETGTYIYQELHLPTQTTAATFTFDYRMLPSDYSAGGAAQFYARVVTATGTLTTALVTPAINYDTGWQSASVTLKATDVANIQAAHDAGQRVYVIFDMVQNVANSMKTYLDNITFTVSGTMDDPAVAGTIAYIGLDASGAAQTVRRIAPDGSNPQTIWTYPDPINPHIYDVAWRPDGNELAFSSDHEFLYSAFHADIYGIQPDGSGLRRITNPPSKADLDAGGYQWGTVTGRIKNGHGTVNPFYVYIEGAKEAVAVDIGGHQSEVSFRVENVADLGAGVDQYIVFEWSDMTSDCANGKEYAAIAVSDVLAGQEVDVGTLTFNGHCYDYNVNSIAWQRDGATVGFFVGSAPKKVPATGAALGTALFEIGTVPAEDLAWSPAQANENDLLYRRSTFDTNSGFYLTTVDGGIGTLKTSDRLAFGAAVYATPAWLPDGSGFVYTLDNYIYEYTLASSQIITLATFYNEYVDNPSVSPDGNYVVFERMTSGISPIQYDLWVLNRSNPVEMWPLTTDGRSFNPDWSQATPSGDTPIGSLNISGEASGAVDVTYTFTATAGPASATQPITYTWQATGQSDVTHTGGDLDDTAAFSWSTAGTKQITVTAQNAANSKTAYHTIDIGGGGPANIQINYPDGAPGSYFQIKGQTGSGVRAMAVVTGNLLVNGQSLGAFSTDVTGAFTVTLHTSAGAGEGEYRVNTSVDPGVRTAYQLDGDAPSRPQAPGDVLEVPATIDPLTRLYLPLVLRQ